MNFQYSKTVSTIAFACICGNFAIAQRLQQPQSLVVGRQLTPTPASTAPQQQAMTMPLIAPVFLDNDSFSSQITLVNELNSATSAEVMLQNPSGAEIARKVVSFPPHSQQILTIKQITGGKSVSTGSIKVIPEPAQGMSIAAQLSVESNGNGRHTFLEEEFIMLNPHGSRIRRAVAVGALGSPVLALKSVASVDQTVSVDCFPERGPSVKKQVRLSAGELAITSACTADDRVTDVTAALANHNNRELGSVGISVSTSGDPTGFAVYGVASRSAGHGDSITGLNFDDPADILSSQTAYAGMPVGGADLFPNGHFTPQVAVVNFGQNTAHVTVLLATTTAGQTTTRTVQQTDIPANSTVTVPLPLLSGDRGLQNSFVVKSDAPPGAVFSKIISTTEGDRIIVDALGKATNQANNAGGHPWTIMNGAQSTQFLFNYLDTPTYFNVNHSCPN